MSKRDELMKYLSLTPWNTNPAILNEKIDEIVKEEGSSGEGSNDFSTAEVTFHSVNGQYSVKMQIVDPEEENAITEDGFSVDVGKPVTKTVLLYKGKYLLDFDSFDKINLSFTPVTTGDITVDIENNEIYITGNGTFSAMGTPIL